MTVQPAGLRSTPGPATRRRGRTALVILGLIALWVVLGFVRAPSIARDYFDATHGSAKAIGVEARLQPAVPPFWGVEIHGNIIEPGASGPGYISAMILWVEPVTGWVVVMGRG